MANDKPFTVEEQIDTMKKYVTLTKRARMRDFLQYSGYFRASRYGKYLLSYTNVFAMKPSQDVLFALYQFDFELRKVMYEACAKAEIQIKSAIANAVSLKLVMQCFIWSNRIIHQREVKEISFTEKRMLNFSIASLVIYRIRKKCCEKMY